jgi:hypothetical protein
MSRKVLLMNTGRVIQEDGIGFPTALRCVYHKVVGSENHARAGLAVLVGKQGRPTGLIKVSNCWRKVPMRFPRRADGA